MPDVKVVCLDNVRESMGGGSSKSWGNPSSSKFVMKIMGKKVEARDMGGGGFDNTAHKYQILLK